MWDLCFRRGLFDRELDEWARLERMLESFSPSHNDDILQWKVDRNGCFLVKTTTVTLRKIERCWMKVFMSRYGMGKLLRKLNFFLWTFTLDSINTVDKIQRRYPSLFLSPNICVAVVGNLLLICVSIVSLSSKFGTLFVRSSGGKAVRLG